nr:MAG TPA: hypothetical protein [Caudoviricetes sp.]
MSSILTSWQKITLSSENKRMLVGKPNASILNV